MCHPDDIAAVVTTVATTYPDHLPALASRQEQISHSEKAQLFSALAVLLRRSMLIGPLWCKVAPLMAKIVEYLSKIKCGAVPAFSQVKNLIGRVLRDHMSKFLERLATPKGEHRG